MTNSKKTQKVSITPKKLQKLVEWNEEKVNDLLKELINGCGINQEELAAKFDISRGHLNYFLAGKRQLSRELTTRILNYFGYKLVPQKITRDERKKFGLNK